MKQNNLTRGGMGVVILTLSLAHCTNYGLYEKMTDPDSLLPETLIAFTSDGSLKPNGNFGTSIPITYSACTSYSGIFAADCACQMMATNAGLPMPKSGKYVAWLSSAATPAAWDMTCRIQGKMGTGCSAPKKEALWKTSVGAPIASSFAQLFSGSIESPMDRTADGQVISPAVQIWTGTKPQGGVAGGAASYTCSDWSNGSSSNATVGYSGSVDFNWSNTNTTVVCSNSLQIYCFGQMTGG